MPKKKLETPGKKTAERSKYDPAWKTIIKQLFQDFLEFFFPKIYQAIDFSKGIAFLDKELNEIDPDSSIGDRIADILAKVHLKDGSIKYICLVIHIEVQSQPRPNFMERMFIYYYRAFNKEKKANIPVISLALLTDDNENYRPDEYLFRLLGFELRMKIPIIKILDYRTKPALRKKLETSTNPMVMVVNAQLKSHEVKRSDNARKFEAARELIRQCYAHGYSKETTHLMIKFFDWVIRLPEVYKGRIKEVIKETEEEYKMEYVAIWERDIERSATKRGLAKGMAKGMAKGLEKGLEKGLAKGLLKKAKETAAKMLEDGLPIEAISKYTGLSAVEIKKMAPKSH
ncbi:MAG TPA: hypothetical protein VK186_27055 [Candidatus Deferrimicrobium sp.]|nr:hypothetical protein [Candidatus Deferrimicrobium sp.]